MIDNEKNGHEEERDRLLSVYRGWQRAMRARPLLSKAEVSGLAALFAGILFPLDWAFWKDEPYNRWLSPLMPRSVTPIVLALLVLALINIPLAAFWFSRNTKQPELYRMRARIALILVGGIPLAGKAAMPAWHWLQKAPALWMLNSRPVPAVLDFEAEQQPNSFGSVVSWTGSGLAEIALMLCEVVVLLWGSLWLTWSASEGRLKHWELLAVSLGAHALLCFVLFSYSFLKLRATRLGNDRLPWRRQLLLGATLLSLLPLPLSPILGVLPEMMSLRLSRPGTLSWHLMARRRQLRALPLWLGLEDSLGREWQRIPWLRRLWSPPEPVTRQPEPWRAESRSFLLYELSTWSLAFEAACLAWGLSWLAEHSATLAPALQTAYLVLFFGSLLLCTLALGVETVHLGAARLRVSTPLEILSRYPYAVYLAKTQFAFACGLYFGLGIRQENSTQTTRLVITFCLILFLLKIYTLMLFRGPGSQRLTGRTELLLGFLLLSSIFVIKLVGPLGPLLWTFRAWIFGRWLLPWQVLPFTWRDIFDPALPRHLRLDLAILTLASTMPLGGLAIPICLFIRHRHWPEAQALWVKIGLPARLPEQEDPGRSLADFRLEKGL